LTRLYYLLKICSKIKRAKKKTRSPAGKPLDTETENRLSKREQEILNLLADGLSNKEIGAKLELSPFTVRNHLAHVFEKLKVRSRTEAAIAYLRTESRPG
jgi:DNA-binding NarL/FixJ family response regulator